MPIGFLRDDSKDAYFIGRDQGFTSRIHKVELSPSQVRPDTIIGTKLFYSLYGVPVPYTRITSVNLYSHTAGAKLRLALYKNFNPSVSGSLLWESPEVDSVEEGWVSIPISAGSVPTVEITGNSPVWIAIHSDLSTFKPSLLSNLSFGDGFVGQYGSGSFPERVGNYLARAERFAVYFTHQEASLARFQLVPFLDAFSPEYTRDRRFYVDFSATRGQPSEIDISRDPDFTVFQTYPALSTRIEQSFPEDAVNGDSIRLYIRTRNDFSESAIVSDTITLDEIPPPAPPTPTIDRSISLDGTATFRFVGPNNTGGGSAIYQLEIQVGSTPNGNDIATEFRPSGGTIVVDVPGGATAYARVRAYDLAGNVGEWSFPSQGVFVNGVPMVSDLAIDPPAPVTSDDIVSSFALADVDDDVIQTQIQWVLNGDIVTTSNTLSAELTTRDQNWRLRVRGQDERLQFGPWAELSFTIRNSLPTLPFVRIIPETPDPDEDLIVDVQTYSTDADGDEVGYKFKWFKSTDGGVSFIEKIELRDSPQVSRNFISVGDLWEVNYIPFEIPQTRGTNDPIEGYAARDRVYIGDNQLPEFQLHPPFGKTLATRDVLKDIRLNVYWNFNEPDGEACTVSLFWTDKLDSGLVPVALNLPAENGHFIGEVEIPSDRPIYLHGIITDAKGAIVQRTTGAIREGVLGHGMVAY